MVERIEIRTSGKGLFEITDAVNRIVDSSGIDSGICHTFIQHTSAGLIIQENADPSAKQDLERWLDRHVMENDPNYTHTAEGPDDMPSHIRSVLTGVSLAIPVINGQLGLGTWQGIYVWEHRRRPHTRSVLVHVGE